MSRKLKNFIGGEWLSAKSGKSFKNFNPADAREAVSEYPLSGREEAAEAVAAAQANRVRTDLGGLRCVFAHSAYVPRIGIREAQRQPKI